MNRYAVYQRAKILAAPLLRRGVFSVEIVNPAIGFFAHLSWCLEVLHYCEQRGLTAQMSATSPQYRDPARSANWLSYFFNLTEKTPHVDFRISHRDELCIPARYFRDRTIEHASDLAARNLPLKEEIRTTLDEYYSEHFRGKKILGVHFRGSDKTGEAPRASEEAMRETVSNYLRANPDVDGLFVATVEQAFYGYMRDSFPSVRILPAQSETLNHFQIDQGSGNYKKGKDALVDCLLLSRCSALVRTASFLSAWASIFNPKLPIVLVNRPYADKRWFPETALISRSMDQYLPAALSPQTPSAANASTISGKDPS